MKKFFDGFKNCIDTFFEKNISIAFFVIVLSLGWILDLTFYSYSIICFMFCVNLLFRSDLSPFLICLPSMMFVFNEYPITTPYYVLLSLSLSAVLLCFCVYLIRESRKGTLSFKFDKRSFVILIALLGLTLGGIFSAYFSVKSMIFAVVIMGSTLVYYLFIKNFSKIKMSEFLYKMFLISTIVIIIQLIYCYVASGNPLSVLQNKGARVGIGEINLPATVLAMAIPLMIYKAINSKYDYIYILFAVLTLIFVVMTCCRGALLFAGVFGLLSFIVYFIKTKRKSVPTAFLGSLVAIALVAVLCFKSQTMALLEHFIEHGFDDSGRFDIWKLGVQYFLDYPVFGVGLQAPTWRYEYTMIHCSVIQILACTGVFGTLCFIIYFIDRYRHIFKIKNNLCIFGYFSILICACYGLIDQTITCAIFHMIVFVILLAIDENLRQSDYEKKKG